MIAEPDYADRTDFTDYDDLNIPNDLVTWVRNHHEGDANMLEGLKHYADYTIGG